MRTQADRDSCDLFGCGVYTFEVEAFGVQFKFIDLPTLIRIKEAAGRPKDLEAIAELKVLLEEIEKKQT